MTFILVALFIASMTELLSGKVPCFLKRSLQFRAKLPLAFHEWWYKSLSGHPPIRILPCSFTTTSLPLHNGTINC